MRIPPSSDGELPTRSRHFSRNEAESDPASRAFPSFPSVEEPKSRGSRDGGTPCGISVRGHAGAVGAECVTRFLVQCDAAVGSVT